MSVTPTEIPPGWYQSIDGHVIRVSTNKARTHVWAERMVLRADADGVAVIGWVKEFGLGSDLIIVALRPRAVSRLVRQAVAA